MDSYLEALYPILAYAVVMIGFVVVNLVMAHLVGPRKSTVVKNMPYESGMDPVGDARQPFDVRYYLVAILFIVFDVELLLLYPWAVSAYGAEGGVPSELGGAVFTVMRAFVATLAVAYLYAWKKGVFRWR